MRSTPKVTRSHTKAGTLAEAVSKARDSMTAFLEREGAVVADVLDLRVKKHGKDGVELTFDVSYRTETTIGEWLDEAMAQVVVGQGPGTADLSAVSKEKP